MGMEFHQLPEIALSKRISFAAELVFHMALFEFLQLVFIDSPADEQIGKFYNLLPIQWLVYGI